MFFELNFLEGFEQGSETPSLSQHKSPLVGRGVLKRRKGSGFVMAAVVLLVSCCGAVVVGLVVVSGYCFVLMVFVVVLVFVVAVLCCGCGIVIRCSCRRCGHHGCWLFSSSMWLLCCFMLLSL